jgi:lysophospholipase L1-like esterase
MGSVTGLYVGQTVTGAGIPNGTTISSISGTVLTMSQNILTAGDNNIIFTPSSRLALMCPTGYDVRNIFISHSHNDAYFVGKYVWGRWNSVIKQIKTRLPQVPITIISQNPEASPAGYVTEHNRRCKMMANIAAANDASFIDVYQAFRNSSTALSSLLNSDGVHPSDASGSPLWRDTVLAFLTNKA